MIRSSTPSPRRRATSTLSGARAALATLALTGLTLATSSGPAAAQSGPSDAPPTFLEADPVLVGQETVPVGAGAPPEMVSAVLPPGPGGTGTLFAEAYQYQLPTSYEADGRPHPLLVAYHGFGASAASVANQSTLDELCNQRGWVYLSVTGLDDKLFGTAPAQQHVEAVLDWMLEHHNVDPERIFMVGFSMGAGVTINFAARHRDPAGLVLAGVGLVSTSADWTAAWTTGNASTRQIMEAPLNFGGPPAADPFGYKRWSGASFAPDPNPLSIGTLHPDESMLENLAGLPVYMTWDGFDPTQHVVDQCNKLANRLTALGAPLEVKTVFNTTDPATGLPAPHSWAVLKEGQLFDFFGERVADRRPAQVRALVAEDSVVAGYRVTQRTAGAFSAFEARRQDGLALSGLVNVGQMGCDAAGAPASGRVSVDGGHPFTLTLGGYAERPAYLLDRAPSGAPRLVPDVVVDPAQATLGLQLSGGASLDAELVARADWSGDLSVSPEPVPADGPPPAGAPLPAGGPAVVRVVGPADAREVWLVLGDDEALVDVHGTPGALGVDLRTALVRRVSLGPDGSADVPLQLPPSVAAAGAHLHVQGLLLDAAGSVVASTNTWLLRWE